MQGFLSFAESEVPQAVRESVKEDARIKAFDLRKRMLNDIKEFAEYEETEDSSTSLLRNMWSVSSTALWNCTSF